MNTTLSQASAPTAPTNTSSFEGFDHFLRDRGSAWAKRLERVAAGTGRWGLVAILLALGAYKFTEVEANAIVPLVSNSPLMGWLYAIASVRGVSAGIGVVEISFAVLLALHVWSPKLALIGGLGAMGMFLTTLSFVVTTPGVAGSPESLGFLVKDLFLFAAAAHAASVSLAAASNRSRAGAGVG